jgi:hypothetical protein
MAGPEPVTEQTMAKWAADKTTSATVVYAKWCSHCQDMRETLMQLDGYKSSTEENFEKQWDIYRAHKKNSRNVWFIEEQEASNNLLDYFPHVRMYRKGSELSEVTGKNGKKHDPDVNDIQRMLK